MMAASVRDVKLRSLELRTSRGSLPFKKRRFDVFKMEDEKATEVSGLSALSLIASTAAALPQVDETESSSVSESSVEGIQRPGLCQGRTSRTNARCKRPIYDGTGYCKLHFQLKGGVKAALEGDESSLKCRPVASAQLPTKTGSSHDKRYQAGNGEPRCKATTTRGRLCAYIACQGSKYCNLHCDFDTAPPPKRKKSDAPPPKPEIPSRKAAPETLQTKVSPLPTERSKRRSASKLAKKHIDSEVPVLSMMSSDQWAKKRVRISVGPLADRLGTVEKWSNGWVTVRVDGVGLHNRRSFELCLLTEENRKSESKKKKKKNVSRITSSPSVTGDTSSAQGKQRSVRLRLTIPETPNTTTTTKASTVDWPITPAASDTEATETPLIPRVTPNSPRKAVTSAEDTGESLGEGLLLSGGPDSKGLPVRVGGGTLRR